MVTLKKLLNFVYVASAPFVAVPSFVHADRAFTLSDPQCVLIEETLRFSGTSEFVDSDDTTPPAPTTGDLSVAKMISGPFRIVTDLFVVNSIELVAICTFTQDSLFAPSAPSCRFEIDIDFCPARACNIQRLVGKVFASGTGPEPYAITGGTNDFMGAFGQLITNGSFRTIGDPSPNGDITLSFETSAIKLCAFPDVKKTTTVRIFTEPDADADITMTATCGRKSCAVVGDSPSSQSCTVECDVGSTLSLTCTVNNGFLDDFRFVTGAEGCCTTTVTSAPIIEARCSGFAG